MLSIKIVTKHKKNGVTVTNKITMWLPSLSRLLSSVSFLGHSFVFWHLIVRPCIMKRERQSRMWQRAYRVNLQRDRTTLLIKLSFHRFIYLFSYLLMYLFIYLFIYSFIYLIPAQTGNRIMYMWHCFLS